MMEYSLKFKLKTLVFIYLSPGDGIHDVNGTDARLDHLLRIDTHERVDGLTVHVQKVLRQNGRTLKYLNPKNQYILILAFLIKSEQFIYQFFPYLSANSS